METKEQDAPAEINVYKRCLDFDHECPEVKDKAACWLYQPERGYCPFLREALKSPLTPKNP